MLSDRSRKIKVPLLEILLQRDHNNFTHTEIKFSSINVLPLTIIFHYISPKCFFLTYLLLSCFPFSLLCQVTLGRNTFKSTFTSDIPEKQSSHNYYDQLLLKLTNIINYLFTNVLICQDLCKYKVNTLFNMYFTSHNVKNWVINRLWLRSSITKQDSSIILTWEI